MTLDLFVTACVAYLAYWCLRSAWRLLVMAVTARERIANDEKNKLVVVRDIDRPPARPGYWYCNDCHGYIPDGVSCDWDWSGNCSAGQFNFLRDGELPRSGREGL